MNRKGRSPYLLVAAVSCAALHMTITLTGVKSPQEPPDMPSTPNFHFRHLTWGASVSRVQEKVGILNGYVVVDPVGKCRLDKVYYGKPVKRCRGDTVRVRGIHGERFNAVLLARIQIASAIHVGHRIGLYVEFVYCNVPHEISRIDKLAVMAKGDSVRFVSVVDDVAR